MNTDVKEISIKWWERTLATSFEKASAPLDAFCRWLGRLQQTEYSARGRFLNFAETYCEEGSREWLTFKLLAEQENKHGVLLAKIIKAKYGFDTKDTTVASLYWNEVSQCVHDRESAAGAGYFAEDLALQRMEVIIEHKDTPPWVREIFQEIVADEEMHVRVLKAIAGDYGITEVIDCHTKGLEVLGLKIKQNK